MCSNSSPFWLQLILKGANALSSSLVNSNSGLKFNLVGLDFGNIENVIDNAGQLVSSHSGFA